MKIGHNLQTGGVSMDIPIQPGLSLPVFMCLENNGLRLKVGRYQLEWFPCSDRTKQEKFINAVCGVLSGRLRVLEHYRGTRAVKAELQRKDGDGWKTVEMWSKTHWPFPWRKTVREFKLET